MGVSATTAPNQICLNGLATDLWPRTARLEADGDVSIGGMRLSALAAQYGTPAYVLDEADVRARCRTYADALPGAEIAYAGKAFLCRAIAEWIADEGLSLDVCSAGELAVARSAGFPLDPPQKPGPPRKWDARGQWGPRDKVTAGTSPARHVLAR